MPRDLVNIRLQDQAQERWSREDGCEGVGAQVSGCSVGWMGDMSLDRFRGVAQRLGAPVVKRTGALPGARGEPLGPL